MITQRKWNDKLTKALGGDAFLAVMNAAPEAMQQWTIQNAIDTKLTPQQRYRFEQLRGQWPEHERGRWVEQTAAPAGTLSRRERRADWKSLRKRLPGSKARWWEDNEDAVWAALLENRAQILPGNEEAPTPWPRRRRSIHVMPGKGTTLHRKRVWRETWNKAVDG